MDKNIQRAQACLQEAVREIKIMSGLNRDETGKRRPLVIGVTSPDFGDGKTTMAIALAANLAADLGVNVTLVDADLETHSIGREFGLAEEEGLSEVIAGTVSLSEVRRHSGMPQLTVIGAGHAMSEPARIAHSERFREVMASIRQSNEFVVVDLPATLHSMAAPVLAQRCDGVVVVVRAGRTTQGALDRVTKLLRDANVLGVVINRRRSRIPALVERVLNLPA